MLIKRLVTVLIIENFVENLIDINLLPRRRMSITKRWDPAKTIITNKILVIPELSKNNERIKLP